MVYPIAKLIIRPLCMLYVKKIRCKENIPKDKAFIVASNHESYLDTFVVPVIIVANTNKKAHFYTNHSYFKNWVMRTYLKWGGCIPVSAEKSKEGKRINKKAYEEAVQLLKSKEIVGIFPEGHRSYDGKLLKAKTGIANLILDTNAAVLPIGLVGTRNVWPKGKKLPKFKRCEANIGKLMHFNEKRKDKKTKEEITRKIMKEIGKLAGKRYEH